MTAIEGTVSEMTPEHSAASRGTGRIGNIVACGLVWTDGSLWVADALHAAILRIG
jgi:hypothetical protein